MSSSGKRLDLRFGVFACSVQGFDDPVQPVQQVLRAIQHLLEETPELADAGINFDAETIDQLVGEVARRSELDEHEVEIVPGLIIIHHAAGGDLARDVGEVAGASGDTADASAGGYVDIFAPREAAGSDAGDGEAEDAEEVPEGLGSRLRRMAKEGMDGGDADYGWADTEDETGPGPGGGSGGRGVFAMPDERGDETEEAEPSSNLFAADTDEDTASTGEVRNLFAAAPAEDEPETAAGHPGQAEGWRSPHSGAQDAPGSGAESGAQDEGYSAASLAERAGARTVPDLMVCAAAFMVLIRGQTQFTRRDVLDVFETIPGDHENTLEARIKGFGKAVRNGRLVETGDGVFGLARTELERFEALL